MALQIHNSKCRWRAGDLEAAMPNGKKLGDCTVAELKPLAMAFELAGLMDIEKADFEKANEHTTVELVLRKISAADDTGPARPGLRGGRRPRARTRREDHHGLCQRSARR
jgi:hypothetical protein